MTLKVLVQLNGLELGGTPINAIEFADRARDHGVDTLLVGPRRTLPDGASALDVAAQRGVPILGLDQPTTTLAGGRELERLAAEHGADLVHTYGTWSARHAYWGPARLGRLPLVMTVYEMAVHWTVYERPHLIVGTRYLVEDLAERPGPVHLVSPPVDLDLDDATVVDADAFLAEHQLDDDTLKVVIVTRLDGPGSRPVKSIGVEQAMDAIERLDDPSVRLVVAGGGTEEARLRSTAEEINHRLGRQAIVLVGPLADPRPAYKCADIMLGMGGSAARSLAFGKPLIVVGEYGWFRRFDPESSDMLFRNSFWSEESVDDPPGMLLEELRPLLSSPELRATRGTQSRRFAEASFGLARMTERLVGIYESAVSQPLSSRRKDWLLDLRTEGRRVWNDTVLRSR